ncbi:hypothetical protein B2J86_13295 [Acidovorax sp. SRB_14]|uniref:hypothetical protein n=1 Tax=Acidovorax sp. SRB_14 TaxID=1962699 RepID=UPI00156776FF|nr:hypothetical protein [Acidovorax sp. SRB_14]NMM81886.1 hypothetical protein [Acidovorax sp. SRB_14]
MTVLRSGPSLQSWDGISQWLRHGPADEETHPLRESVGALAERVDAAVRARRARLDPAAISRAALALAQGVQQHQLFLTGLGSAWHAMHALGAYQSALRELLDAVQAWQQALDRRSRREGARFDRMELLAWRTLGEGLLLIDMYGQGAGPVSEAPAASPVRTPSAWTRLRGWWRRGQRPRR